MAETPSTPARARAALALIGAGWVAASALTAPALAQEGADAAMFNTPFGYA